MNPTITYSATGTWRRVGNTIVIVDAFARPKWELENGGGGSGPGRPWSPSKRQIALLRQFFGSDIAGARARLADFRIPAGLTARTLRWYESLAHAVLADPKKATPKAKIVQPLRLRLVRMALAQIG